MSYSGLDPTEDTESWGGAIQYSLTAWSYSGLDPTEDTESDDYANTAYDFHRYSGLDPTEDTERRHVERRGLADIQLQWARSDRGY